MKKESKMQGRSENNMGNLDRKIFATLKKDGWIIPISEDEVRDAEERLKQKQLELPEQLSNSKKVLDRIKTSKSSEQRLARIIPFRSSEQSGVEQNLARAAREGGEISPDIDELMKKDREAAERNTEEKGGQK